MNKPIYIALLGLTVLIGFYTTALAQAVAPPPALPPPQALTQSAPPAVPSSPPPQTAVIAPAPFGGLYNVLSGQQPPATGAPRPLTPFNTQPLP